MFKQYAYKCSYIYAHDNKVKKGMNKKRINKQGMN